MNEPNLASDEFVITGGGQGGFAEDEAKDLALVLRYGALPVEFRPSDERQVSPTVGDDTLRAGILAGVIGLVAVALYLLVYYRALGIIVVLGLTVWASLMYGVVTWLSVNRGLTLSLAGVVGIVVSIGTTVDSYIVHFERLKDEVRLGKSIRSSTERSFKAAFRTILTADIASLIGASLLWWLTVGAVRGFAFFLGLSVALDIFVMWAFDRPMVALFARSRFFTEHPVFGVARGLGREAPDEAPGPGGGDVVTAPTTSAKKDSIWRRLYNGETDFHIVGRWRIWFGVSAAVIVVGLLALGTRGLNLGIDFTGGNQWEVQANGATAAEAEEVVEGLGFDEVKVQVVGDDLRIRTAAISGDDAERVARNAEVVEALTELTGVDRRGHGDRRGRPVVGRGDLREGSPGPRVLPDRDPHLHHHPVRVPDGRRDHRRPGARRPDRGRRLRHLRVAGHARPPSWPC